MSNPIREVAEISLSYRRTVCVRHVCPAHPHQFVYPLSNFLSLIFLHYCTLCCTSCLLRYLADGNSPSPELKGEPQPTEEPTEDPESSTEESDDSSEESEEKAEAFSEGADEPTNPPTSTTEKPESAPTEGSDCSDPAGYYDQVRE